MKRGKLGTNNRLKPKKRLSGNDVRI
jgi:hypothetical protein